MDDRLSSSKVRETKYSFFSLNWFWQNSHIVYGITTRHWFLNAVQAIQSSRLHLSYWLNLLSFTIFLFYDFCLHSEWRLTFMFFKHVTNIFFIAYKFWVTRGTHNYIFSHLWFPRAFKTTVWKLLFDSLLSSLCATVGYRSNPFLLMHSHINRATLWEV